MAVMPLLLVLRQTLLALRLTLMLLKPTQPKLMKLMAPPN
jgi:hypothetical protein